MFPTLSYSFSKQDPKTNKISFFNILLQFPMQTKQQGLRSPSPRSPGNTDESLSTSTLIPPLMRTPVRPSRPPPARTPLKNEPQTHPWPTSDEPFSTSLHISSSSLLQPRQAFQLGQVPPRPRTRPDEALYKLPPARSIQPLLFQNLRPLEGHAKNDTCSYSISGSSFEDNPYSLLHDRW